MNSMRGLRLIGLALALLCGLPGLSPELAASDTERWQPPAPNPDDFDWIRLTSGEWLKGDIKYLRLEKLEFESDKLDTLILDWEDVAEVRSPRPNISHFEDGADVTGTLLITEHSVLVGERRFDRARLESIVAGAAAEATYWSGKVRLGVTASKGNTDKSFFDTYAEIKRQDTQSRMLTTYTGNYGRLSGETNTNNHRLAGGYDRELSRRLFLVVPAYELFKDTFQNIDLRTGLFGGLGVKLVDDKDTTWTTSFGGGYRRTSYSSVEEGFPKTDATGSVQLKSRFEQDIAKDTDLTANYDFQISVEEASDNIHHLDVTFSTELVGPFDFDLTFGWDRINQPVPDADGNLPDKDDYRTTLGVSMDF